MTMMMIEGTSFGFPYAEFCRVLFVLRLISPGQPFLGIQKLRSREVDQLS